MPLHKEIVVAHRGMDYAAITRKLDAESGVNIIRQSIRPTEAILANSVSIVLFSLVVGSGLLATSILLGALGRIPGSIKTRLAASGTQLWPISAPIGPEPLTTHDQRSLTS